MKSLYQYIFELSSEKYGQAAEKAYKLGQKKRAEMFKQAQAAAKKIEDAIKDKELEKYVDNVSTEIGKSKLSFKFDRDYQQYGGDLFDKYDFNSMYADDEGNVYMQFCGFENINQDTFEDAITEYIHNKLEEDGEEIDKSKPWSEYIEEYSGDFWEDYESEDDYFMWLIYSKDNDKLYVTPDLSESGPNGYTFEPSKYDIDEEVRFSDRKSALNAVKLVKILNPETKLTKNNFIA